MITFKQFLEANEAVPGAKNHTGIGSDTQAGANKAKTASTQATPEPQAKTVNTPAKPAANKPSMSLKDSGNADKLEAKLKQGNIKYTKTSSKDGIQFQFDNDAVKRNAARIASTSIDKSKEDDTWS